MAPRDDEALTELRALLALLDIHKRGLRLLKCWPQLEAAIERARLLTLVPARKEAERLKRGKK